MNITFYVSEKDQDLIEQAKRLDDSLLKVIAAALRIYLEKKEAKMLDDSAEKLFNEEIIGKQKARSDFRAKTGSKGGSSRSRKGVRTPYDYMTAAEKKKLNGEVMITSMYDLLLSKTEFESHSEEKQKES